MSNFSRITGAKILGGLLLAGASTVALAMPMSASTGSVSITVTSITNDTTPGGLIDDLVLFATSDIIFSDTDEFEGNPGSSATATLFESASADSLGMTLEAGSSVSLTHDLSAMASGTDAFAYAESLKRALILVDNFSLTDTFTVGFDFT